MPCAVILTALRVEYLAVRTHLSNLREETHPQGNVYQRGSFIANEQSWEVGIAEVGVGNVSAAIEAERAISYFNPDILFFVGIAGGIKDKDVSIGDVVVATKVYGFESGKSENQFLTRPSLCQSSHALVQRAKAEARKDEWLQRLSRIPIQQPRVFVESIASGEKVVASRESEIFQFLRTSYNDVIAVEMEGFGFLSAAFAYPNIKAIVVRGISDLVKDKNDDSVEPEQVRQERASLHASAFAFEILANFTQADQGNITPNSNTLNHAPVEQVILGDLNVKRNNLGSQITNSEQEMKENQGLAKPKIFISYSHQDSQIADNIVSALDSLGLSVWLDRREIKLGDSFLEKMNQGLGSANYVLVLFSNSALKSQWVTREWMSSLASQSTIIIPILLENGAIPPLLKDIIYINFVTDPQKGLKELTEFFQREFSAAFAPQSRRGNDATTILLQSAKLREIRLVAQKCMVQKDFLAFLFDEDIDQDEIGGDSLNERLINLLHHTKTQGTLRDFLVWLSREKGRCVEHQLKLIREENLI